MKKICNLLEVLSKPLSLRILKLLSNFGEICICEFGSALLKPSYEISKQLKKMREVGLVVSTRKGKFNYYKIKDSENDINEKILKEVLFIEDEIFEEDKKRFKRESCSLK